ncbi:hypothetical protein, partial [Cupriavidus sp. 8B]
MHHRQHRQYRQYRRYQYRQYNNSVQQGRIDETTPSGVLSAPIVSPVIPATAGASLECTPIDRTPVAISL